LYGFYFTDPETDLEKKENVYEKQALFNCMVLPAAK